MQRLTHLFALRVLLGHQELISVLWSNWSRFGLLCFPEEKLDSGNHYRIVILSWESVAKMRGVNPLANEPNRRGERKKEKEISSRSLKHSYRTGFFCQEAAKISISSVFLRYHNKLSSSFSRSITQMEGDSSHCLGKQLNLCFFTGSIIAVEVRFGNKACEDRCKTKHSPSSQASVFLHFPIWSLLC